MGQLLLKLATSLSYELDGVAMGERQFFRAAMPLAGLLRPHDPEFARELAMLAQVAYHSEAEIKAAEVLCYSLLCGMRPSAAIDKAKEAKFFATFAPIKVVLHESGFLEP
jgi:hypothetical protein